MTSRLVDVVDVDRGYWGGLALVILGGHVVSHDVGQRGPNVDARDFDAEHGRGVRVCQGVIVVRADRSRLRRPEHVDGHPIIVTLDEIDRDLVRRAA